MPVSINMPGAPRAPEREEKSESILDKLLAGLDVATKVTGIYSNIQNAREAKQKMTQNEALLKIQQEEEEDLNLANNGQISPRGIARAISAGKVVPVMAIDYVEENGRIKPEVNTPVLAFQKMQRTKDNSGWEPVASGSLDDRFWVARPKSIVDAETEKQVADIKAAGQVQIAEKKEIWDREKFFATEKRRKEEAADRATVRKENRDYDISKAIAKQAQEDLGKRQKEARKEYIDMPTLVADYVDKTNTKLVSIQYIQDNLDAQIEQWKAIPDGDIGQKYAQGQILLKVMNSIISTDAVGAEERSTFGGMLEFKLGDITNKSPAQIGRDLEGFSKMISSLSSSVETAKQQMQYRIAEKVRPYLNKDFVPPAQRQNTPIATNNQPGQPSQPAQPPPPSLAGQPPQASQPPALVDTKADSVPKNMFQKITVNGKETTPHKALLKAENELAKEKDPARKKLIQTAIDNIRNLYGGSKP